LLRADWRLVRKAPVVYVAPPTVDTVAEFAARTRALIVGTAELLICCDLRSPSSTTVAFTTVILPPEIVTVTVTDPNRWVAVDPVYVPSLYEDAAAAVVAALVAAAVVAFVAAAVLAADEAELAAAEGVVDAAEGVVDDAEGVVAEVVAAPLVVPLAATVCPLADATAQPAARTPADATAAAIFALALTRRTSRCGWRRQAYLPPTHRR
jgi:hypothetical protein